jgi:hypothetical protein
MKRTLLVGDVHGCSTELEDLLERVDFDPVVDRLVLTGDLVVRGPDPRGTLALVRRLGATSVRGNHEAKLLSARDAPGQLGPDHAALAGSLTEEEWAQLEAMPLWLDLPAHGVRVVHAGVVPGADVRETPPEALLKMRTLDAKVRWSDEPTAGALWGTRYEGPPHVVFGHNARPEPQLHPWATGLDTGCVYGGKLTGLLLAEGATIPRGDRVRPLLRSVPARRKYVGGKGTPLEGGRR